MTVTDCGTSRNGVSVFVALLTAAVWYPADSVTVTVSRTPAIRNTNSRDSEPFSARVTLCDDSRKPFADALTV